MRNPENPEDEEEDNSMQLEKQAYEDFQNKMRYREFLIDLVEQKLKLRKSNQRIKKLDMLRDDNKDDHFEIMK